MMPLSSGTIGVGGLLILATHLLVFCIGWQLGGSSVQEEWDTAKQLTMIELSKRQQQVSTLQTQVANEVQKNNDMLTKQNEIHAIELARLESEWASRLQLSDKRAHGYMSKARGTETERANLACHAAQLDRAVTEGQQLVAELAETIRQREHQLNALSQQIILDRKLFSAEVKK